MIRKLLNYLALISGTNIYQQETNLLIIGIAIFRITFDINENYENKSKFSLMHLELLLLMRQKVYTYHHL